ncbi:spore germination protein [Brevibacillus sp. SYSU BS000544]|uniref:spore germination protein n=1 Tax=Brevibacillus sp. SYSU BS000544 TaxID=3416443 RepID=UPI003CE44BD5
MSDTISDNLEENTEILLGQFSKMTDFVIRRFKLRSGTDAALVYFDGLVDRLSVNEHLLKPLIFEIENDEIDQIHLPIGKMSITNEWKEIEYSLFIGISVLFVHQQPHALMFDTQGWPQRAIKEPQIESSLKGGHQGFTETADQNISLIRRYLPNRELKIRNYSIGRRGKTRIFMMYLEDIVNSDYLKELERRMGQIDVDAVLNTGELAEFLEDRPFSIFPQVILTERPDAVASQLLQGRVTLVVDHSPSAIVLPASFATFFQSVDDYSSRWVISSFLRVLRFIAFLIATCLPATYIAMISFHYEVIPVDLLISVGESRARVPFPPIVEALIMELAIEMLREAGLRVPSPIGQTIGVVGGIIIGQAAVQAGVVSNIMVVVVAITAISSFIIPNQDMALSLRLIRFPMMLVSSFFGMVGITIGLMIIIAHIISLESLQVPFGSPIIPVRAPDWKDTWIRVPLRYMINRPLSTKPKQLIRQKRRRP